MNRLAAQDAAVHKLLFEVLHLLRPQSALRDPDLTEPVKALAAQAWMLMIARSVTVRYPTPSQAGSVGKRCLGHLHREPAGRCGSC